MSESHPLKSNFTLMNFITDVHYICTYKMREDPPHHNPLPLGDVAAASPLVPYLCNDSLITLIS